MLGLCVHMHLQATCLLVAYVHAGNVYEHPSSYSQVPHPAGHAKSHSRYIGTDAFADHDTN